MNFTEKVVLITGAGSGIGEAIALHFAKLSANLSLIDKDDEGLTNCAKNCEKLGRANVCKLTFDLSVDENVQKVVDETVKEYGKIDVVVHCAGIFKFGNILDPDIMESYDKIMAINLRSVVLMTNRVAPFLIKTQGCIINVSSIAASVTVVKRLSYSILKASLSHLTRCVALELASKGVRINTISPGAVPTNILVNEGMSQEESDVYWELAAKVSPLKRNVDADEIAEMTAYLASDKAKSITGANFTIDSGLSLVGVSISDTI